MRRKRDPYKKYMAAMEQEQAANNGENNMSFAPGTEPSTTHHPSSMREQLDAAVEQEVRLRAQMHDDAVRAYEDTIRVLKQQLLSYEDTIQTLKQQLQQQADTDRRTDHRGVVLLVVIIILSLATGAIIMKLLS